MDSCTPGTLRGSTPLAASTSSTGSTELIKYKGHQVPPAEIEAVLLTHSAIADAAVIGVKDAESGEEVPKAFVVTQPGADLTDTEVMEFVANQVAPIRRCGK